MDNETIQAICLAPVDRWETQGYPAIRTRPCPTCLLCAAPGGILHENLSDRLWRVPGTWTLRYCPNARCGLIWLDPTPLSEDIAKLYTHYYTHATDTKPKWITSWYGMVADAVLDVAFGYKERRRGWYGKVLGILLSHVRDMRDRIGGDVMWLPAVMRGNLLDIGCGNGEFLARMKGLGWQVMGIDPDPVAIDTARNKHHLDVVLGSLDDAQLPDDAFDVATLSHVIEHLPDPMRTLTEVRRMLKNDGHLVISTPNSAGFPCRHFGRDWLGFDPPRHLYLFGPDCLETLARKSGFEVVELRTVSRDAASRLIMSHLVQRAGCQSNAGIYQTLLQLAYRRPFTIAFYQLCQTIALYLNPTRGETLVLSARKR